MPPFTNATLTEVRGSGTSDDWDSPAAAGAVKFAGAILGYYRETVDRLVGAGGVNVETRRTFWLDTADYDATGPLDTDDVITLELAEGTFTGTVQAIARSHLAGIPGDLQTTRIELTPA